MDLDRLVNSIEQDLCACAESEVSSGKIGEMVMDRLVTLNEVAYVRFASVYRRFTDVVSFERELSRIRNQKTESADNTC